MLAQFIFRIVKVTFSPLQQLMNSECDSHKCKPADRAFKQWDIFFCQYPVQQQREKKRMKELNFCKLNMSRSRSTSSMYRFIKKSTDKMK